MELLESRAAHTAVLHGLRTAPPTGAYLSRACTKPSVPLQDCFERVVSLASRDAEDRCVLCIWHPLGSA